MEEFYYKVLTLRLSAAERDRCLALWCQFSALFDADLRSGFAPQTFKVRLAKRFNGSVDNIAVSCVGTIYFLTE